ncbi:MAG: 4-hydroxybenzoate octaprenyltransferase [Rhodocyclaceae bacterium]
MNLTQRLDAYERLMRLDKPIGILLLLWPTLWSLWASGAGRPNFMIVWIFVVGTVLMRSAGCVVNDWADRDFDGHVKRTAKRPLITGEVGGREALILAGALTLLAGCLILPLNRLVWALSVVAVALAATYPFFKRFFAIPQAYLGIAFGFGIPMAYAAQQMQVPLVAWVMLLGNIFWAVAYDTEYAMVNRDDDLKLGMRTSAITFGRFDVLAVMLCYAAFLGIMVWVGTVLFMGWIYYAGLVGAAVLAGYHYTLIRTRSREGCFKAFIHNNWLGGVIFIGMAADYYVRGYSAAPL